MTSSFVKSAFCLPLAVVCLLGFTGKAFAEFGDGDTPDGSYSLRQGIDTIKPGDRSFGINFDRAKSKITVIDFDDECGIPVFLDRGISMSSLLYMLRNPATIKNNFINPVMDF